MSKAKLIPLRLADGVWEGILTGVPTDQPPQIAVHQGDLRLDAPEVIAQDDGWLVRVTVPTSALSDGMQVFLISLEDPHEDLASFAVLAGDVLRDDIRSEVTLLRAELDMLKRAFRRHCRET